MNVEQKRKLQKELSRSINLLIVPGNNIKLGWGKKEILHESSHMSPYSLATIEAACFLWKKGMLLLLITGDTVKQNLGLPSEARAMYNYARRKHPQIPSQAYILGEKSFDTNTNVPEVLDMFQWLIEAQTLKAGVVSIRRHGESIANLYDLRSCA